MQDSLQEFFDKVRAGARRALVLESLLLGLGAFLVTSGAANLDQLNPFRGAALACEVLAAVSIGATWIVASKNRFARLARSLDARFLAQGNLFTAFSLLQERRSLSTLESLCLMQARRKIETFSAPSWSSFFRPVLSLVPLAGLVVVLVCGSQNQNHSLFSWGDREIVSQIQKSTHSLAQTELKETVVGLQDSLERFERGKMTRPELRRQLEGMHQQLEAFEKELARHEPPSDLARSQEAVRAGENLAQAMGSLEKAIRALPESKGADPQSGPGKNIPLGGKTESPSAGSSATGESRVFGTYRWPSRFDSVVRNYFRKQQ